MTVDELVDRLTKPTYVFRMAKASRSSTNPAMRKSANTRMMNARSEIDKIVQQYVNGNELKRFGV